MRRTGLGRAEKTAWLVTRPGEGEGPRREDSHTAWSALPQLDVAIRSDAACLACHAPPAAWQVLWEQRRRESPKLWGWDRKTGTTERRAKVPEDSSSETGRRKVRSRQGAGRGF